MVTPTLKNELNSLSLEELFALDMSIWERIEQLQQHQGNRAISAELLQALKQIQQEIDEDKVQMIPWQEVQEGVEAIRAYE